MSKKMKVAIGAITSSVLLVGLLALSYFVLQVPLFDASRWDTTQLGQIIYRDYYGRPSTGLVEVDGVHYFFDETDCTMRTGWLEEAGERYFLHEDGAAHTGWLQDGEDWYYFDVDTCVMQTSWLEEGGNRYYFSSSGKMWTGWLKSGDASYYLAPDGKMQTGWLDTEQGRYYLNADGKRQISWLELDGAHYFFNVDGTMRTGWLRSADGTYFLTDSGAAYTGWMTTPQCRYYMLPDGKMATGFVEVNGIERYFWEDGAYIPLVNREHKVPADYMPVLVEVEGYLVDETCRDALMELMEAARAEGHEVVINSAFRDEAKQQSVWEEYREGYMAEGYSYDEAEKMTARYVAVPGTSEHHLGLAIDFGNRGTIYDWLAKNSWRYGFILRYIKDGGEVAYEPWHFRYVGKDMAKDVYESAVILEKYLDGKK